MVSLIEMIFVVSKMMAVPPPSFVFVKVAIIIHDPTYVGIVIDPLAVILSSTGHLCGISTVHLGGSFPVNHHQ